VLSEQLRLEPAAVREYGAVFHVAVEDIASARHASVAGHHTDRPFVAVSCNDPQGETGEQETLEFLDVGSAETGTNTHYQYHYTAADTSEATEKSFVD